MTGRSRRALAVFPAATVAVLLAAGCATGAASPQLPATVTAVSASDPAAVTLSTGQQVYDVGTAMGITTTAPTAGSCERIFNDTLARGVLSGATVTAMSSSRWVAAPAGYTPAELTYAEMQGMAMQTMFSHPEVASKRAEACPRYIPAPATTTTTAPSSGSGGASDTDVYVDVDREDHHESRYCRRHWFC